MTTFTDLLTCKPAAESPDSDTSALLLDPAASESVWLGYLDSDTWPFVDGMAAMTRLFWADVPAGAGTMGA